MDFNKVMNLTGHEVKLISIDSDGVVIVLHYFKKFTGKEPRILEVKKTSTVQFGGVINLPKPRKGWSFIVSRLVAMVAAKSGRDDLLVPSEPIIKDGKRLGVLKLVRVVSDENCPPNGQNCV